MREQKLIKKQLIKSMLYNFIAFSIIFTVFGAIIYNTLKIELYKSVDNEIEIAANRYNENNMLKNKNDFQDKPPKGEKIPDELKNMVDIIEIRSINPRIVEIVRDKDGNAVNEESIGRFYDEYYSGVSFNKTNLDNIYDIKVDKYYYRAINLKTTDENGEIRYIQLLINVDAEKNIIDNYINILTLGIVTTIILSLIASYVLSKYTLKPIIASWQKQTEFVQNASHELRTPLTIIQTKQELLLQDPESKIIDKSEDIRLTLNEAKRLGKLTKDLMLLARADSNVVTLNKEEIEIDNLIKEIVLPYQEYANVQGKKIILNLNYGKSINIDRNQIHQLMVILLDNAMKYTEENDIIEICTSYKDGKCAIEVKDSGIGVSDETIKHAFDRFYREDKARSRATGGSGLGLAIAHFIADSHAGTIKLEHNKPKGTMVIVKLPK